MQVRYGYARLPMLMVAVIALCGQGCMPGLPQRDVDSRAIRGLWVTRWDYQTAQDVREIMHNAARLGATDVYWQVRGQADAYYRSRLEPWGEAISVDGSSPGFDPLRLAVRQAHRRGLRLHAWANVMPLWKGKTPPRSPDHAFYTHPEWRLRDAEGNVQPLQASYAIVDPTLEAVREHIASVFGDIARRYDVDGIHLDYIRFVPGGSDFAPQDPAVVRNSITQLVARIRRKVKGADPSIELSAAVWRRPEIAANRYCQDAAAWLRAGLIDRALPMIYTDDDEQFRSDLSAWIEASGDGLVTPGIGVYKHKDPRQTQRQVLLAAMADGYSLFAYSCFFETTDPNQDMSSEAVELRAQRRALIAPLVGIGDN